MEELDVVEGGFRVAVDGADVRYATAEGFELPVDVVFVGEVPATFGGVEFEVRETEELRCQEYCIEGRVAVSNY